MSGGLKLQCIAIDTFFYFPLFILVGRHTKCSKLIVNVPIVDVFALTTSSDGFEMFTVLCRIDRQKQRGLTRL